MLTCSVKEVFRNPEKYIDRPVKIAGWTRTVRSSKSFGFIELNDGSFFRSLQVVFEEGVIDNFDEVSRMPSGSSIEAFGEIVKSPGARQLFELKAYKIIINGISSPDYPLQKKRHSFEFLRTIPHLRARTNTFSAVFRVRSILSHAIHSFFQERGFVYVHTPIITSNDAEGAGEMFRVTTLDLLNLPRDSKGNIDFSKDFFGRETNLTVSGQLAVESYCMAFGKVYTFGPTFRAENSNTARHSSEFWMIEPEIAFADIRDNMELAEDLIKYVIDRLLESAPEEMQFFNTHIDNSLFGRLDNVLNSSFEVISYTEAVELLKKENHGFQFPADWGNDLQTEHERFLTEKVFKKPVFVIDYPKDIKAFYMRVNDDGKTVAAMDLLVPGVGELIGGSQREERHDILEKRMKELGMNMEDYWWYLDLRRFGGTRHAGFGLGFERAVMYLTGITNIRDVIPFPRTPKSAEF